MTVEPWCGWGGGVSHLPQLTTGLGVNSFITTSPTLAGERILLIPKVSILSEQIYRYTHTHIGYIKIATACVIFDIH